MLLSQMRETVRSDVISPHIGNDMGLISGKDTVPGTSRLVFFRPFPPVLARVRALLRRMPLPRTTRFRVAFRSQMPPILCFCEGGLRT